MDIHQSCFCGAVHLSVDESPLSSPDGSGGSMSPQPKHLVGSMSRFVEMYGTDRILVHDDHSLLKQWHMSARDGATKTKLFCGRCGCNVLTFTNDFDEFDTPLPELAVMM